MKSDFQEDKRRHVAHTFSTLFFCFCAPIKLGKCHHNYVFSDPTSQQLAGRLVSVIITLPPKEQVIWGTGK